MGIFDWIRGGTHARDDAGAAEVLEHLVQLTNPRLRFARRYRARLMPAVQAAMNYARSLVASVPPSRDASPAAWQSDSCLRAFFATPDDIARAFSRSPELRAWFDTNPAAQEVHVVLSMLLTERRTLGVTLESGVMRRDVPQTTVSFGDYRARICGRSESDLREEIERRVVDQLALAGLAIATQDESQREVLEQERALLRARLRLLEQQGSGMSALGLRVNPELGQLARIKIDLAVNEENLRSFAGGAETLEYQLESLRRVLGNPAEHFFLSAKRMRVDRMNVVLDEDSPSPGETLDLQVARIPIPDGAPEFRTFMLVRFPRSVLLPKTVLQSDAARMLH